MLSWVLPASSSFFVSIIVPTKQCLGIIMIWILNYTQINPQVFWIDLEILASSEKKHLCIFEFCEYCTTFFTKIKNRGGKWKKKEGDLKGP